MKLFFLLLVLTSSLCAQAHPMLSMKERLRIHLWTEGLEVRAVKEAKPQVKKPLPEELERALQKI